MPEVNPIFFQRWRHSREEDASGLVVYRPDDFPFPPTRFREAVEFGSDGSVTFFGLGADDRRVPIPGHWAKIDDLVVSTEFADPRAPSAEWRLTEEAGFFPRLDILP
jgi:hypothetical protein